MKLNPSQNQLGDPIIISKVLNNPRTYASHSHYLSASSYYSVPKEYNFTLPLTRLSTLFITLLGIFSPQGTYFNQLQATFFYHGIYTWGVIYQVIFQKSYLNPTKLGR